MYFKLRAVMKPPYVLGHVDSGLGLDVGGHITYTDAEPFLARLLTIPDTCHKWGTGHGTRDTGGDSQIEKIL